MANLSYLPTILLSNDDGIHAPGIHVLAKELSKIAKIIIVAPHRERSANSHLLTVSDPLRVVKLDPLPYSEEIYEVTGSPVDCIKLGLDQLLSNKPDWVFSGINRGGNLGTDVLYSGTVAAAMEGVINGCKAMAFSSHGPGKSDPELHYETAAHIARVLLEHQSQIELPKRSMLNVNVPAVPLNLLKGVKSTFLGQRVYGDHYMEKIDPRGIPYFWLGSDSHKFEHLPGSDCNTVNEGWASASLLQPTLAVENSKELLDAPLENIFSNFN